MQKISAMTILMWRILSEKILYEKQYETICSKR